MVILSIIGGVVVARYPAFKRRAIESEAKFSLLQVHRAQMQFFLEFNRFATLDQLLLTDRRLYVPERYYWLKDGAVPKGDGFSVMAIGREGTLVAQEVWQIDENKELVRWNKENREDR